LGWIAATPNSRIYLFFFFFGSPEKLPEVGSGWRRLFAEGGRWVAASVRRKWAMGHLVGWLISLLDVLISF
jgi:hypothetical protein